MQFQELDIIPAIQKALVNEHYTHPTPIQAQAIPRILEGRDVLGCAQTGTGKTAAFAIPTIQLLSKQTTKEGKRPIRALILTPTRELAMQIYESFKTYGKYTNIKCCVIFGGVSQKPQEVILQKGVDVLVATPGRLNDLIQQQLIDISTVQIFVLDEADRMLDMGFIHDVQKVIHKLPKTKQTLLFSATIPPEIVTMADSLLVNPVSVHVTPVSSTVDIIDQSVYFVDKGNKKYLLADILADKTMESVLVFSRTKHGADKIVKDLLSKSIVAQAIHGNKSQNARQLALNNFKNRKTRVLVATDIAARGIDIDELSHVINYDLPNIPETYVHRIGRTGRAGLGGTAISLCDFEEQAYLKDIEKLIGKKVKEVKRHDYPMVNLTIEPKKTKTSRKETSTNQDKAKVKTKIPVRNEATNQPSPASNEGSRRRRSKTSSNPTNKAAKRSALERDPMTNQESKNNQKTVEKPSIAKIETTKATRPGANLMGNMKAAKTTKTQSGFAANAGKKPFGAAKKTASFSRTGSRSR